MPTTKLPAFQFYAGDWRKDPGVQSLSYHDRGVWFEILCLMHESQCRGVLLLNGQTVPEETVARLLGLDVATWTATRQTLLDYGVASLDQKTKALVCRRMVRDEKLRQLRADAGSKGGNQNPAKSQQTTKQNATIQGQQNPPPSSSSSASASPAGGEETPPPPDSLSDLPTEAEVIAFGATAGIPAAYCASYHIRTSEKRYWRNASGVVIDWPAQLTRYWTEDRDCWQPDPATPAPAPDKEAWRQDWLPWLQKTSRDLQRNTEYQYADPLVKAAFWRERKAAA